jgi:DNA-binding transcriptional MerR regulator
VTAVRYTFHVMGDLFGHLEIPQRALFKAAEVCELVNVQPYVLRSWEMEFPELGISKTAGGPRVYRRADVERVLRIKHLLLVDGLTLAGARRRLDDEAAPVGADAPLDELIGRNARDRLTAVKRGLRAILDLLADRTAGEGFQGTGLAVPTPPRSTPRRPARPPRRKSTQSRDRSAPRRKRPS